MAQEAIVELPARVEEEVFVASQWRLMWWRFRRHKPAIIAGFVLGFFYLLFPFSEFLGPGDPAFIAQDYHYLRPQPLRFFDDGKFRIHVNGLKQIRNPVTLRIGYETVPEEKIPVGFFVRGFEYAFLGFIKADRHLIGFADPEQRKKRPALFLLGSDQLGRDQMSRLLLAVRISLSIGLVGVTLSLVLGIIIGGISGFYGGIVDTVIQRIIEVLGSIPTLPLWMALSASVPNGWSILQVYLAITVILSIMGWTGTARVVRGKYLALREEDFVMAARIAGSSEGRIMFRHMLPSFYSHLIATTSLAIPGMILGETALSFLGLGLRPPAVSFGVMLILAQNVQTVALYPWLMFVAVPVIVIILAFNFLGDGLRDAADPYGR